MNNSYVIQWKSKVNGRAGRGTKRFEKEYKVITTDGARVVFPTGWALVRASNTEPAITYRFESTKSEEDLERIKSIMREALKAEGVEVKF